MRFRNFVIASTLSTALWTALLTGAGYKLQENFCADRPSHRANLERRADRPLAIIYVWRLLAHKGDGTSVRVQSSMDSSIASRCDICA